MGLDTTRMGSKPIDGTQLGESYLFNPLGKPHKTQTSTHIKVLESAVDALSYSLLIISGDVTPWL